MALLGHTTDKRYGCLSVPPWGIFVAAQVIAGGDFNVDGSVDAVDGEAFVECLAGPLASPTPADPLCVPACLAAFDDDGDGDLDLLDFAAFMRGVTP